MDEYGEAGTELLQKLFVHLEQMTKCLYVCCRWAQWLAGLDFLPALPAGLVLQGEVHHSAVQRGLTHYRKEKRAMHVLRTLLRRAEQTLILQ